MARRRYTSTDISTDKKVNKLATEYGDFAALLYTWMIPHTEDDCEITGDPEELMLIVCPGRRDKTEEDIKTAINGMINLELVFPFVRDRKPMLLFPPKNFYKYQTYISRANRNYGGVDSRATPQNAEEHRETPKNTVSPSLSPSLSLSPSPSPSLSPIDGEIGKREEDEINEKIREINDRSFELGMSGVSNEFLQDIEIRLKEGTEAELITKALAKAKDNASSRKGICPYAISILQGWAAEGIKTIEQWNKKYAPKARDKPERGKQNARNKSRDTGSSGEPISGIGIEI